METLLERPRVVYNRDAPELAPGIPRRYRSLGPGSSRREFEAEIRGVLAAQEGTKFAVVSEIAAGTLPKAAAASFARNLVCYTHRIGAIDGLVAWAAEFYGFDQVIRLTQPMAQNFGYMGRELPLAEKLVTLVRELGGDERGLPIADPSLSMEAYLRVRQSLAHGGAEIALASTFPEAQWATIVPQLEAGFVKYYGVAAETAALLRQLPALDESRSADRIPFILDIARSMRQQRGVIRAMREILSVFAWTMSQTPVPGDVPAPGIA